jgi:uncharacterized membrane protein
VSALDVSVVIVNLSTPKHPKPRIGSLSDLIFGLALSIGTISLISSMPRSPAGIIVDVLQFGFSFLILISVWFSYSNIMSVLPVEDIHTIVLNTVMLFLVSVEPYLFYLNVVFDLEQQEVMLNAASIAYALDMAGLMAILALFTHELTIEDRKLLPQDILGNYRRVRNSLLLAAVIFGATILPVFWTIRVLGAPLRFYVWFVPLVASSIRRVSGQFT